MYDRNKTEAITLNERLKQLRKQLGLTQEEFGKKIGCARNTIANYEMGKRTPSSAVITLICKEYGVNEVWLRTGEGGDGNMFAKMDEDDKYSINLGKLSMTENIMAKNMINAIAEASPEKLKHIEEFMRDCLGLN